MMFRILSGLLAFLCLAHAQSSLDVFEDLARRAEAAQDVRPAEAVSLYRQALVIRPAWPPGWLYMGAALYQLGRFAQATDAFRKGVSLAPGLGTAWAFLGLSEAELDNTEQALSDIRKGIELGLSDNRPFEVAVRVKAALLLNRAWAFDEAMALLIPMTKKNENSPILVEAVGLGVLADPRSPAELTPERKAIVGLAGRAAWEMLNLHPAEAAAAYKELLERYGNEPGVHYAYSLYVMENDLEAALKEFEKELQINPANWPARMVMANLQVRQGVPDAAIETLKEAMKTVPPKYRWLGHTEMGHALLTADKPDAAAKELQIGVRLKPANAQIYYLLAQAYRRAGKKEEAAKANADFQRLKLQQDPLGVPAFKPLGN